MPSDRLHRACWVMLCILLGPFCGCMGNVLRNSTLSIPSIPLSKQTQLANPVAVNTQDSEFLWNQIVDTVEDYFRIKSEQRPTRDNLQWVEGRMETHPEVGATYFEPWRKDALEGYQRWQSTLQTIRRTAIVRVLPTADGFAVGVEVVKELEAVDRSQYSSEGSAVARHDGSIARVDRNLQGQPQTLGWVRQENDVELEQRLLREILGRVSNVSPPRRTWFTW